MSPTYRSFAKINLHLQVMGRRDDGYHELETVFQSVELADLLTVETADRDVELQVLEGPAPAGPDNLAHRAAVAFLERFSLERGVRIALRKRIPVGGGLGGGSSNAAAVLLALQEIFDAPGGSEDMFELARRLGADVPFFLVGGTALGTGRGDQIRVLDDLEERRVWLVMPALGVSTSVIFRELGRRPAAAPPKALLEPGTSSVDWGIVRQGWNDLEATTLACYPELRAVYNVLVEAGATVVRLCGSGASLFALFSEPAEHSGLSEKLPSDCRVVVTRTLTRSLLGRLRVVE